MLTNQNPDQLVAVANYQGGSEVTQPREFGSGRSRLVLTLLNDPLHVKEAKLPHEDWLSLVTWIDLNAQYWGTFVEKDGHYASRKSGRQIVPPRRVRVVFPDPWQRPPAGRWTWLDEQTAGLEP